MAANVKLHFFGMRAHRHREIVAKWHQLARRAKRARACKQRQQALCASSYVRAAICQCSKLFHRPAKSASYRASRRRAARSIIFVFLPRKPCLSCEHPSQAHQAEINIKPYGDILAGDASPAVRLAQRQSALWLRHLTRRLTSVSVS